MNYSKIYSNLIQKAKKENTKLDVYYEKHHIIPICMSGADDVDNIVLLTPEQHFTAHLLLAKTYDLPALWYTCNLMSGNGKSPQNNITPNRSMNKTYGFIRKNVVKFMSIETKNRWAVNYGFVNYAQQCEIIWNEYVTNNKKVSDIVEKYDMPAGNVQRTLKYYSNLYGLEKQLIKRRYEVKSEISKYIRKNITPEQEARRIKATKEYDYTERNKLLSKQRLGENNPVYGKTWTQSIVKCPHCHKKGGVGSMKRWHFENCKDKV